MEILGGGGGGGGEQLMSSFDLPFIATHWSSHPWTVAAVIAFKLVVGVGMVLGWKLISKPIISWLLGDSPTSSTNKSSMDKTSANPLRSSENITRLFVYTGIGVIAVHVVPIVHYAILSRIVFMK